MENRLYEEVEIKCAGTGATISRERIIRETELTVRLNGELCATAMILAGQEKEYAAGFLYSQGIISSARDIHDITVNDDTVDVTAAVIPPRPPQPVESSLTVNRDEVFTCVRAILKSPVFTETEAVHSAGLFQEGKTALAVTEDIGRAHAFDKVIGAGLFQEVDFSRVLAASTGRMPAEMISKCQNAGIPIIATKGVPTAAAVELALKFNITIAGLVRGKNMIIYSHPERIQ